MITYCCQKLIIANRYYISLLFHLKCVAFCFVYFNTHLYSISEKIWQNFDPLLQGLNFIKSLVIAIILHLSGLAYIGDYWYLS